MMPPSRTHLPRRTSLMATATKARPAAPSVKQTKLLINGKFVDHVEGKTFDTVNPATGEVIAKVAEASAKDVDKAVKATRQALEHGPWAKTDAADRGRLMFRLADLIERESEDL